jgi:hypothetical protein
MLQILLLPTLLQAQSTTTITDGPWRLLTVTTSDQSQSTTTTTDGLSFGIAINHGGKYFESDADFLNDIWSGSVGFEFRVLWEHRFSSGATLGTGLQFITNRYILDDQIQQATNELGLPTGRIGTSTMDKPAGTAYLGVPLQVRFRPFGNQMIYAFAGTDLALKIASTNRDVVFQWEPIADESPEIVFVDDYNVPELSRDIMVFANAGIGLSLPTEVLPLNIELGLRQSITPYMDRADYFTTWLRTFTLGVSYRIN